MLQFQSTEIYGFNDLGYLGKLPSTVVNPWYFQFFSGGTQGLATLLSNQHQKEVESPDSCSQIKRECSLPLSSSFYVNLVL